MFLDNNKKIICLSVPKTGTTTCSSFFYEKIKFKHGFYPKISHCNLQELLEKNILKYNLNEYKIYGVVREPLDRFLSGMNHIMTINRVKLNTKKDIQNFIKNEFKRFNELLLETCIFRKQNIWLSDERVKIYRYRDIDLFVKEICDLYDIDYNQYLNYGRLNVGAFKMSVDYLDEEILNKVLEYYSEDLQIYEKTPLINS